MRKNEAPVKIGPDMPELPQVRHDPTTNTLKASTAIEGAVTLGDGRQVVREEKNGLVVETVVSVDVPRAETREELKARVKTSVVNDKGLLVETY